jgi:dTDP-4-amino-4,6-dideoxygalactose transaminase
MMINIPQANPGASYQARKRVIDEAVLRVLESGRYILGAEVAAFESEFALWHELTGVMGVGSGTDAITLALKVLGIGAGSEVITTTHTATATIAAIELAEAIPVLVDIDSTTYNLDAAQVEQKITARTRAIIPVHLYGLPADLDALVDIAREHDLALIEDCAQAHGARYRGSRVGKFGIFAAFSFYPTKNLGAIGDGGALGFRDEALGEQSRQLAQYGWKQRYISDVPGMNSRLDELQAAILRVKLQTLEADNARRVEIARRYTESLAKVVNTPQLPSHCEPVYHLYVIRHQERDQLRKHLSSQGIGTAVQYAVPIHLQPAYRGRLGDVGSFPNAEHAAAEILSLPIYPELTNAEVDQVIEGVLSYSGA